MKEWKDNQRVKDRKKERKFRKKEDEGKLGKKKTKDHAVFEWIWSVVLVVLEV
jgi:hypothetical protein